MKQVSNLRSAVSKNALLCVTEMFTSLKSGLDSEIGYAVPTLFKKIIDSQFLKDESKKALMSIIDYGNESKILSALEIQNTHKSSNIRVTVSLCNE
jgi:hypothetical protein